jgi:hypothetical protein
LAPVDLDADVVAVVGVDRLLEYGHDEIIDGHRFRRFDADLKSLGPQVAGDERQAIGENVGDLSLRRFKVESPR